MLVMDGLEATRRLRLLGQHIESHTVTNFAWLQDVPIIAMMANAMLEDHQRCLDTGMNDHISKPIELPTLKACLLRWIAKIV